MEATPVHNTLSVRKVTVTPDIPNGSPNFWFPGYDQGEIRREQMDDPELSHYWVA